MKEGPLRELLAEADIDIIHKNARGWLVGQCPFAPYLHEYGTDSNPSFFVKVNPAGYSGFNCFTCHQKGNLTVMLNKLSNYREVNYQYLIIRALTEETPESFEDWDRIREEERVLEELEPMDDGMAQVYLSMYPLAWEHLQSREYLQARGGKEVTSRLLDLRFDPEEQRILFPVYGFDRELYGFTGRTILDQEDWPVSMDRKVRYSKVKDYAGLKKDRLILGEHLIQDDPQRPLLVVEGLFALAHMIDIGVREFADPIATMGSYMSDAHRDIIIEYGKPVHMLYDNDAAGRLGLFGKEDDDEHLGAIDKLIDHVPVARCLYPKGITDPDDLTLNHLRWMIQKGKSEWY